MHGQEVKGVKCAAMDGIIEEAEEIWATRDDEVGTPPCSPRPGRGALRDHRYGTLIAYDQQLGRNDCASVLQQNLDEEKATDRKLTALAESKVNRKAA